MAERIVIDSGALAELLESDMVARELVRVGVRVERTAKHLCPVDTGRLRASVTQQLERDGRGLVEVVGTNVDYAPYVELGTRRNRAQPFLRPALAQEIS